MNVDAIADALKDFVRSHNTAFSEISSRQSQLLELAAVVAVHEHYRANGYCVLNNQIRPKDHAAILRPFLPSKYSPLQESGDGLQSV